MKLAFSTALVPSPTFFTLCNTAAEYGYEGMELHDLDAVAALPDGPFGTDAAGARRKLRNRRLALSALTCPTPADGTEVSRREIDRYCLAASDAGIPAVIVTVAGGVDPARIAASLRPVAEQGDARCVRLLFETTGDLANTERLLAILHAFRAVGVGAAWNIRATYFEGGESAETTITTLGAYIAYVRIGDRRAGENVLLGEGELPTGDFLDALRSLNYDGYCVFDTADIADADLLLTHSAAFLRARLGGEKKRSLQSNRAGTGTFPWKKYEVIDKTFSQVLDEMAETYPDQYAFRYPTLDYTRTYRAFREDVDRIAASLIALGVKPGYHVAVWATNVPQWFLTFWAAVKIGAVLVTVNTAYKIQEAEYLLRQSDTHTLVMIENCKDSDYRGIMTELCPELKDKAPEAPLYAERLPFLRHIVTVGFSMPGALPWERFSDLGATVPPEEVRRLAAGVRPDDVANMQYTSGTTGFPKGVMLTHRNIVNNGKIIGDRMDLSTADRMMVQVPMFHCFGMVLTMTSIMTHGGTLCPLPYFSPKSSLACITEERITCFNGVPTMFIAMFAHEDFAGTDFSHVRTGIMAGANCPAELMRRAAREMHMTEIVSVFGQTEASPGCTMGEVGEDLDHRVETVGTAFPGVECKIIDPETGEDLPDGENGEFVARGFNIMKGYYKMPRATAATIDRDGWLHTGDICCRTPEGYFRVTGRLKDMIIRGGENLYPREIEEFYLTHPKVKDVQVIGVPDARYGEEACAWIVLHDGESATEEEMRDFGRAHIASHKVPRYFVFVRAFPMNAAGKILKYKMRETMIERLGLADH